MPRHPHDTACGDRYNYIFRPQLPLLLIYSFLPSSKPLHILAAKTELSYFINHPTKSTQDVSQERYRLPIQIARPPLILVADAFPSSEAFEAINAALTSSDAERKDAIKQGNAVFAFTLKNKAGETDSWHIDLKNKGEVGKGLGDKPTGMLFHIRNRISQI